MRPGAAQQQQDLPPAVFLLLHKESGILATRDGGKNAATLFELASFYFSPLTLN